MVSGNTGSYPDGSQYYIPPSVSGYYPSDLSNFGAPQGTQTQVVSRPRFEQRVVAKTSDGVIVAWRVIIEDVRGGLNRTNGYFSGESEYRSEGDFDRIASSDADGRYYRTLCLPQKTTTSATPATNTNYHGLHSVNIFNKLYIAVGQDLFSETSSTDPTVIATSVTTATLGEVTALASIVSGSTTASARILIGSNGVASLYDAALGVTAMNANSAVCYGAIQTFVNNQTILMYCNTAILTLDSTVASNTALTAAGLNNVPQGGYALGLVRLGGGAIRAAWVWPKDSAVVSIQKFGAEAPGRVVTTSQEGQDYQLVPMGISRIISADIVNGSAIVATDGQRVMYYDGRTAARDLNWIADRVPNSDRQFRCRGVKATGNEIWVEVNYEATPNATASTNTQRWFEVYNLQTNAWHQVSIAQTLSSTGDYGVLPCGGFPLSEQNNFLHVYSDGSWRRIFVPPFGYNPYTLYNQTVGAGSTTGNEYESTATYTSPYWELPGLEGSPKIVNRIRSLGDVDAGGTAATAAQVSVSAGNMTAYFGTGFPYRSQEENIVDNMDVFYKLRVSITGTRTTASTHFTPNFLPVIVEGYAFVADVDAPSEFLYDPR